MENEKKNRQIIIETDGSSVNIVKNECSDLESWAILQLLLNKMFKK